MSSNGTRETSTAPDVGPPTGAPGSPGRTGDIVLVILLGIIWGTAFPVIRAGLVAGAPPLFFAALRYLLTATALVPIALASRTERPTWAELASPAAFGGVLMIGAYGGLLYVGEVSTTGGLAAVLTASAPLVSALVGFRLLPTENFGRWGTAGLLVGFVGVAVLVLPGLVAPGSTGISGPVLVVLAVVAFAVGSVLLRKTSKATPGFWTLAVQFAVAGAILETASVALGERMSLGQGVTVSLTLAFLVVFPGILGYTLYFRIHHTSGPTLANVVGYVNPATGLLVGILVFGENVTVLEIGGLVLIGLGLFFLPRDRGRKGPGDEREDDAEPPRSGRVPLG